MRTLRIHVVEFFDVALEFHSLLPLDSSSNRPSPMCLGVRSVWSHVVAKILSKNLRFNFYTFLGMWAGVRQQGACTRLELGLKIVNWVSSGGMRVPCSHMRAAWPTEAECGCIEAVRLCWGKFGWGRCFKSFFLFTRCLENRMSFKYK